MVIHELCRFQGRFHDFDQRFVKDIGATSIVSNRLDTHKQSVHSMSKLCQISIEVPLVLQQLWSMLLRATMTLRQQIVAHLERNRKSGDDGLCDGIHLFDDSQFRHATMRNT